MEITQDDMQTIINAVLSSIRTNSRTIEQLTPVTSLNNDDSFEINGGKRVTYAVLKGMLDKILNVVHDLGNMSSVEAAMNAAKAYAVVSNQNTRIIVWTHGNDAGIIFQTHLGMEHVRQLALLDGSPAKCKARHLTINITDHTVADGGWQELITPVSFSYDSVKRAITANGPKNPGNEPAISWPVVTLPLAGSSYAGLMEPADKKKLGCIVDLGVVSNQAAAENAAAERSITENSDVRIIMWRTGDNGSGDGGSIIQSRWGTHYVVQVMMFVGQERSCRYRLITTGGNYSVGEWNDLILPSEITYDTANHQVRYRGIRPNIEETLFTIPVADDEELGIIRIGGPFYLGENDELNIRTGKGIMLDGSGNIQAKVNTAHGLDFYRDNSLAVKVGKGLAFETATGGITVRLGSTLCYDEDDNLQVRTGQGIDFEPDHSLTLNLGTGLKFDNKGRVQVTVSTNYTGLRFDDSDGLRISTGAGISIDGENCLTLSVGSGLKLDYHNGLVGLNLGTGLEFDDTGKVYVNIDTPSATNLGSGLMRDEAGHINVRLSTKRGPGLKFSDGGLELNIGNGLTFDGEQVVIDIGTGLLIDSDGHVEFKIGTSLFLDYQGYVGVRTGPGLIRNENGEVEIDMDYVRHKITTGN